MTIEKEIYSSRKPNLKETIRLASESADEEAQMELDQLLQQFEDYNDGIQVIEIDGKKESFSNYIKRMGGVKDE